MNIDGDRVIELATRLDQLPAALEARAADYRRASQAVATLRAYRSDLRDFEAFCRVRVRDLAPLPAAPATVSAYLAAQAGAAGADDPHR